MLRSLLQLFKRPKPRKPAFDGRMSEVNPQGGRIKELLRQFVEQGNQESTKQVLHFVNSRMDDAVRVESNKTHEALMQAHQEAVETETFFIDVEPAIPTGTARRTRQSPIADDLLGNTWVYCGNATQLFRHSFIREMRNRRRHFLCAPRKRYW
ncbi:hypothetical protein CA54_04700 [Symmachiella macrocystis]|uniref:Uncharacterized protein n=1 Tax=Symmachiella macrocystis TaxID=2527985 RepID=A0A5C6BIX7_9PLAN|nr:hypothetical protein CA54_04700 [Symmachiella macrocystis]